MVARAEEGEGLLWMSEANVLSAQKELKEPVNFHTAWKNDMHEPVEILSPSRRSSLPSLTFFELSFSPFFHSPSSLVSPFYFSFCRRLSLATLYSRGAKLLATFEFNFLTQRRCRKTFTGYKGSPMESANYG